MIALAEVLRFLHCLPFVRSPCLAQRLHSCGYACWMCKDIRGLAAICILLFVTMLAAVLAQVLMRYFFASPLS